MRATERSFAPHGDTCLKYFDYKGAAIVVDETTDGVKDVDGRKILPAGTPYPSNDASCKGYILQDYDVTNGSQSATYLFEGSVDNKILTKNGVTVDNVAKTATPRVTFFD